MVARKPDDERLRRNKPRYLQHVLEADGIKRGPDLPEEYDWCEETKRWYEDFRYSPNAQLCEESDWEHIHIAALLHNKLWGNGGKDKEGYYRGLTPSEMTNLSKEIRTRMSPYGYTNEDRLRLNIDIASYDDEAPRPEVKGEQKIDYAALLREPPVE
jgi:hypothetical protein